MLMRFDPFREFDRLAQSALGPWGLRPAVMPMDAYRHNGQFVIHFDLPGVDPGSVDLTAENDVLSVTAQRRWSQGEGAVVINERPQSTFSRQLFLGEGVDIEQISAHYDNGVLTITVPVAEQAKPRKVEITSGGNGKAIEAAPAA
jgi:HSP20 family protein